MRVELRVAKVATELSWEQVVQALNEGMHNISSSELDPGGIRDQFLEKHGLLGKPCIFMANHSMGGRFWVAKEEEKQPLFYPDFHPGDGWHVLTEENCVRVECSSATSGSTLSAFYIPADRGWQVELQVPVDEDGEVYAGAYWRAFHKALDLNENVQLKVDKFVGPPPMDPNELLI